MGDKAELGSNWGQRPILFRWWKYIKHRDVRSFPAPRSGGCYTAGRGHLRLMRNKIIHSYAGILTLDGFNYGSV